MCSHTETVELWFISPLRFMNISVGKGDIALKWFAVDVTTNFSPPKRILKVDEAAVFKYDEVIERS